MTTALPLILFPLPLSGWLISLDKTLPAEVRSAYFWVGSLLALQFPFTWKLSLFLATLMVGWYLTSPLRRTLFWRHKRLQLRKGLSSTLGMLSVVVKSGIPFSSALTYVAQRTKGGVKKELDKWVLEFSLSGSPVPSIKRSGKEWKIPILATLATTVAVATKSGGALAIHLEELAKSMKGELDHEERVRTLTLNSRLQGMISIPIPIFAFLLIYFSEPELVQDSLNDPLCQKVYFLALCLQLLGAIWIIRTGRRR